MEHPRLGFDLVRSYEAYAQIHSRDVTFSLVAAGDDVELVRLTIRAGGRFGIRPEEGFTALESVVVLSGALRLLGEEGEVWSLGPGDTLAACPIKTPLILEADNEATLLYVSSKPGFGALSGDVRRLTDLAVQIELKDGYTADHCRRIRDLSSLVGRAMGLSPSRIHWLLYGAFLHDIGKARLPAEILLKRAALSEHEWELMRQHPLHGEEMLKDSFLAQAAPIVAQHHERVDGCGYPRGLTDERIALEAKIVAVVDAYDAMTSDRPYHAKMTQDEACQRLRAGAGSQFAEEVVATFLQVLGTLEAKSTSG